MTMATYRVLDVAKPFGGLQPGVEVELTEVEAAGFADKLELVASTPVEAPEPVVEETRSRGRKRAE